MLLILRRPVSEVLRQCLTGREERGEVSSSFGAKEEEKRKIEKGRLAW